MTRGATAKHIFNMWLIENPKAIQVTYKQGNRIVVQKQMDEMEVETILNPDKFPQTRLTVYLSQQETFKFRTDDKVVIQVRVITAENESLVSKKKKIKVYDCLDENLLPLGEFYPIIDKPERGNN